MLVEWRETTQAHVRRAVGENPEIQGVWIPSANGKAAPAAPAAGAKGAPAAAAAAAAPQNGDSPFSSAISSFLQTPVAELTVAALIGAEAAAAPAGDNEVAWRDLLLRLVHARREDDAQPEAFRLGMVPAKTMICRHHSLSHTHKSKGRDQSSRNRAYFFNHQLSKDGVSPQYQIFTLIF